MRNPFQIAPRCVQWAAVTLVALPVFNIVAALNVTSFGRFLSLWRITLPNLGVQLGLAVGLLFGLNLVRILFAGLMVWMAAAEVFAWHYNGFSATSLARNTRKHTSPETTRSRSCRTGPLYLTIKTRSKPSAPPQAHLTSFCTSSSNCAIISPARAWLTAACSLALAWS